jgi:1-acyl-sn-glycerol-3-phosphate acyltransferase
MPRQGNVISRAIGWLLLKSLGWKIVGGLPNAKKLMIIVAPHTSNWDYILAMAAKFYMGLQVRYLMKSEINVWPFRGILKWTGGVPVYRSEKTDILEQTIDWIKDEENVWLGMSPEGTRSKIDKWKTGFLRIAHGADIPILVVGFNAPDKTVVIDKLVALKDLKGDLGAQAKYLQEYCGEKFIGIKPENQ